LFLGGGIIAWGAFGLLASDKAEEFFGFTPTSEDKEKLKEVMPRVREVERR
jgi:hypothetical protein